MNAKMVNNVNLKPLIILAKRLILHAWLGAQCASTGEYNIILKFK